MNRTNSSVMMVLLAAIIAPRFEQLTGHKPTPEEVAEIIGCVTVAWHGLCLAVERGWSVFQLYFPPPVPPTQPVTPAKEHS